MAKKNDNRWMIIFVVLFLLIFWWGGNHGWFHSIVNEGPTYNNPPQTPSPTPTPTPTVTCTDADGGNNIFLYGVCSDNRQSIQDNCQSASMINENWCQDGTCWGATYNCPVGYHCWDGACVLIQEGSRDCALIAHPTSQVDCTPGLCSTGNCVYYQATVYSIARCACS